MKIRVAHVTTVDISLWFLLRNQLKSLQDVGFQITAISSPGSYVPKLEQVGIRHIAVPMTRTIAPLADIKSLVKLARRMRKERFTIVHTHNPKPGLLGQIAARMAGVPIVVNTIHGFYFHENMSVTQRRFFIFTEKVAARCSDVILSQSQEDVRTAISQSICPREQIIHLDSE